MQIVKNLQTLIDEVSVVKIVGAYVTLKKISRLWKGLCPFHNEDTPSFVVNDDKKFFYCFGCGAGGNIFHFLMKYKNMTLPEAIQEVCSINNIKYISSITELEINRETKIKWEKIKEFFNSFVNICNQKLMMNEKALKYLAERDVNMNLIYKFRIGYDDGSIAEILELGYDIGDLKNYGILQEENWNKSRFINRIILPITNSLGDVISVSGRIIDENNKLAKYLHSVENPLFFKKAAFFNLHNCIKNFKIVYIVEGFFDMISMENINIPNVLASLGSSISDEQIFLLNKYFKTINLIFDGDSAGLKGMINAAKKFLPYYGLLKVQFLILPPHQDPGLFFKYNSIDQLQFLPLEEFLWRYCICEANQLIDGSTIIKIQHDTQEILKIFDKKEEKEMMIHDFLKQYWKKKLQLLEKQLYNNNKNKFSPLPKIISKNNLLCSNLFYKANEIHNVINLITNIYFNDSKLNNLYNKIISVVLSCDTTDKDELQQAILDHITEEEKDILMNPNISLIVYHDKRLLSTIIEEEFI